MQNKLEYYVNNNAISCSLECILEEYKPVSKKEVLFLGTQLRNAQFWWIVLLWAVLWTKLQISYNHENKDWYINFAFSVVFEIHKYS